MRNRRVSTGHGMLAGCCASVLRLLCLSMLCSTGSAASQSSDADNQLTDLLRESGVQGGFVVHAGCAEGKSLADLRTTESFTVQGLEADPEHVTAARMHVRERGLYGPVSVVQWSDTSRLPYAENMVNLLLIEEAGNIADEEIRRVLVPGGVARIKINGEWVELKKPWPEGMDQWTHWAHGPDGNPVSQDVFVGPPRRTQWIDGPSWSKKHWGPRLSAIVTAGGRLFYVQDETPTSLFNIQAKWVLTARDAFNGVVLWRRELPDWTNKGWGSVVRRGGDTPDSTDLILGVWGELSGGSGTREAMNVMVADRDRLYVPLAADGPLSAIDGATGEMVRSFDQVVPVQRVVLASRILLIGGGSEICAVHAESGDTLWKTAGDEMCVADKKVFVTRSRGNAVACLDLESGTERWEVGFNNAIQATTGKPATEGNGFTGPVQAGAGIVLVGSGGRKDARTVAISSEDGMPLWQSSMGDRPFGRGGGPFFIDGQVWNLNAGQGVLAALNPRTGKPEKEVAAPAIRYVGHHARCYLAKATCRYIIGKERGVDFIDLVTGEVSWNNWLRGPCQRGVLPANGLIYAGQHSCRCYTESALHGFHALAPASRSGNGEVEELKSQKVEESENRALQTRLEQGPAFASVHAFVQATVDSTAWPTFRHDAMRSGATLAALPTNPTQCWSATIGGRLTAPVVAGGRTYAAAVDRHTVYSLDGETGGTLWQYTAGGRIDTPPTIHGGLALFGCCDGWVYCLRAEDGELVWRFRAAPQERMVGAYGQLESAWPVPGSILIRDNIAYCVAGRSSYLDGGLYLLALEPQTGRLLHQKRLDGPWPQADTGASPETPNRGFTSRGALPDVLVADTDNIYLRHLRFDPTLQQVEDMEPNVYVSPELSGENRGGDHKYWDNLLEAPRHANFSDPAWFHRSFFQNFPGLRLYATTGLIDDDGWHRRMYWSYGQIAGQYLVFRGPMGYAVQVFATSPREGGSNAGDGYVVYAGRSAEREENQKLFALRPNQSQWRIRVPFRPVAMVLAGGQLVLAGPPDASDPHEALAAVEGRKGGVLWVVNAANGEKLAAYRLPSPPRYDGMAVAGGRCYLATVDGQVICLGEQPQP